MLHKAYFADITDPPFLSSVAVLDNGADLYSPFVYHWVASSISDKIHTVLVVVK